jgi:hypothetical protein
MYLVIHCKNFCKCPNVPPSSKTIKKVESLLCKCEFLSANSTSSKNKKEEEEEHSMGKKV